MKLLAALLGMGLVFSSSAASAQSIGPSATVEVWDGGLLTEPVHPQVAIDSLGRFHVVWAHFTREDEDNRPQFTDFYNIYYTLFTIDGARVTGPTQISDRFDFIETLKPQIAVSGNNTVYVGWHSRTNGIRLIGLNPAAGNKASKPTPLAQIQRFPELDSFTDSETGGDPSNHIYIATDSTGRVHVLIEEQGERFYCAVYNADGTVAEPLRQVLGNLAGHDNGTSSVSIRLDDSDRMHIVNVFEGTNNNEVAYALVDCATGATLIDTTLVSPDDMVSSMQPTMELIAGIVYIVWIDSDVAEASCSLGLGRPLRPLPPMLPFGVPCNTTTQIANDGAASNRMRFIALDPSLDDMDGDAAVLAFITTVAETGVSLPASVTAAWYPAMGFREDEIALRIAFFNGRSGDPNLMTIDLTGAVIDPATVVVVDPVETEPREYTRPRATKNGKMAVKGRVFIYPDSSRIMMRITGRVADSGTGSCGLVGLELLLVFPFLAKRRKKRSGSII